jgi:4a-hydroxytetrahydrobiopterin dehydratase
LARYACAMAKLDMAEVNQRLAGLHGWALEGDALTRQFTFAGFSDAVAFIVRLGFEAEAADHHPDIFVNYKRVTLTYFTHSEGGLTEKDFAGAAMATGLATSMGAK